MYGETFDPLPPGSGELWADTILDSNKEKCFEIVVNVSGDDASRIVNALRRRGCTVEQDAGGKYRVTRTDGKA